MNRKLLINNEVYHLYGKVHREDMAEQTAKYHRRDGYLTKVVPHDGGWRIFTSPKIGVLKNGSV